MIDKLTPEQEARFDEYVERWTAIGLSTEPADRPRAEAAINWIYQQEKLSLPRIIWHGSPKAMLEDAAYWIGRERKRQVAPKDLLSDVIYGSHDVAWIAFYAFFREVVGLRDETKELYGLTELSQAANWALPYTHVCWVSERPSECHLDDNGLLHCEDGPAIVYPDGWSLGYAIHGVHVEPWIIMEPEKITLAHIRDEENTEIRSVLIDRYGRQRFLTDSRAELIHEVGEHDEVEIGHGLDGLPVPVGLRGGKLWRVPQGGNRDPVMLVEVRDPSDGSWCYLMVPPDMKRVRQAVAWTFDLEEREYNPELET